MPVTPGHRVTTHQPVCCCLATEEIPSRLRLSLHPARNARVSDGSYDTERRCGGRLPDAHRRRTVSTIRSNDHAPFVTVTKPARCIPLWSTSAPRISNTVVADRFALGIPDVSRETSPFAGGTPAAIHPRLDASNGRDPLPRMRWCESFASGRRILGQRPGRLENPADRVHRDSVIHSAHRGPGVRRTPAMHPRPHWNLGTQGRVTSSDRPRRPCGATPGGAISHQPALSALIPAGIPIPIPEQPAGPQRRKEDPETARCAANRADVSRETSMPQWGSRGERGQDQS